MQTAQASAGLDRAGSRIRKLRPARRAASRAALPVALALLWSATIACAGAAPARDESIVPDWSDRSEPFYPLNPATAHNPVLTRHDVSDIGAWFVADPFLMRTGDGWFLFFEVDGFGRDRGRIGYATSSDGLDWHYQRIVLEEAYHLSYPCVFEWNGEFYMVPESSADESVRLYKASPFPDHWTFVSTLLSGRPFADANVFRHDGTWWMFVGSVDSAVCELYFSDKVDSGWREHPLSPIIASDRGRARPAGRTVVQQGRILRLAQKSDEHYGEAVRAFQVDMLTRTDYAEHEIPESPILSAAGSGWNADGMHHCDPWWVDDHWMVAVDGLAGASEWSIGIFRTGETPVGVADPALRAFALRACPVPFRDQVVFTLAPGGADGAASRSASVPLEIYSAAGALVRTLTDRDGAQILWNGRDSGGRPVPAGTYFCRMREQDTVVKLARIR